MIYKMTKEMLDSLKLIEKSIFNIKDDLKNWSIDTYYIKQQIKLIYSELKKFNDILKRYT